MTTLFHRDEIAIRPNAVIAPFCRRVPLVAENLLFNVNFIEIVCNKSLLFPIEEFSTGWVRMDVI